MTSGIRVPAATSDVRADLCVVVTTYRPDAAFAARFAAAAACCLAIVVVDNTPGRHAFAALSSRFVVLQGGTNRGLGPALNQGIDEAVALGARLVVLFDQDSSPSPTLFDQLHAAWMKAGGGNCAVGPVHVDDQTGRPNEVRSRAGGPALRQLPSLPTSGMFFPVGGWATSERFSETLFLDLVDFDWCWRMGRRGWRFYKANDARMLHRLGLGQRRLLGLTFHVPAPYRHYFQFRDTLRIAWRSYVPIYPKIRLLGILPLKLLAYPWLLDRGSERFRWMLCGILDAIRGRGGAGAAASRLGA